ncbi:MAG TPA: hypothetical protein VKX29_03950 [Brumimicrobium sp.]|nr:hypothetical protein [Brumimicrobium sp.]
MKQGVIYLIILIGGIGIGYTFNLIYNTPEIINQTETVIVEKIKKQIIRDTIRIKKPVQTNFIPDTSLTDDSYDYYDSLNIEDEEIGYQASLDTDEIIIKEELISQRTVPLKSLPYDSTDVSNLLEMKGNAFNKDIIVEFWQSPLNITGYELSRNKLKLFGFNPNESISLQLGNDEDEIFLNTESMSLLLQKTKQFKTLKLK